MALISFCNTFCSGSGSNTVLRHTRNVLVIINTVQNYTKSENHEVMCFVQHRRMECLNRKSQCNNRKNATKMHVVCDVGRFKVKSSRPCALTNGYQKVITRGKHLDL